MSDPGLKLPLYIEVPQLHRYVFDDDQQPIAVVMTGNAQHLAEVIVAALTADAEKENKDAK